LKQFLLSIFLYSTLFSDVYYYEYGKKVKLTKLKEQRDVTDGTFYYKNSAGQKVGVRDEILVKCNSRTECEKTFIKYSFKNTESLSSNIFLIKLKKSDDIFEISQKLYLEKTITIAHPNFIKKRYRR